MELENQWKTKRYDNKIGDQRTLFEPRTGGIFVDRNSGNRCEFYGHDIFYSWLVFHRTPCSPSEVEVSENKLNSEPRSGGMMIIKALDLGMNEVLFGTILSPLRGWNCGFCLIL